MTPEKYLFHLPENLEHRMAAAAVLCTFSDMLRNMHRPFNFYLSCPRFFFSDEQELFLGIGGGEVHINSIFYDATQVDVEFTFDVERAWRIAQSTERHITNAFGVMLGVDQPVIAPRLIQPPVPPRSILICEQEGSDTFNDLCDIIQNNAPDIPLTRVRCLDPMLAEFKQVYDLVSAHSLVIAPGGVETYMAASLGNGHTVLELYTPETAGAQPGWLNKVGVGAEFTRIAIWDYSPSLVWRMIKHRVLGVPAYAV